VHSILSSFLHGVDSQNRQHLNLTLLVASLLCYCDCNGSNVIWGGFTPAQPSNLRKPGTCKNLFFGVLVHALQLLNEHETYVVHVSGAFARLTGSQVCAVQACVTDAGVKWQDRATRTRQAANMSRPVVIRRCRPKAAYKVLWCTTSIMYCTACCLRAKTNSSVAAHAAAVNPVTRPVADVTKNLANV